jgi:hypothetical protein
MAPKRRHLAESHRSNSPISDLKSAVRKDVLVILCALINPDFDRVDLLF